MAYTHDAFAGIALRIRGPIEGYDPTTGEPAHDPDRVHVVMVGDDRTHVVYRDDLRPLKDADYCHECGQVGCAHDGAERDER